MADAEVIKELLVAIGWKVDQSSQQQAQKGIKDTGVAVDKLQDLIDAMCKGLHECFKSLGASMDQGGRKVEEGGRRIAATHERLRKGLIDLGKVSVATATGFAYAMREVAKQYTDLYYLSQRTGASVQNLQAITQALSGIGGAAGDAAAQIQHMTSLFNTQPGSENQLLGYINRYLPEVTKQFATADQRTREYVATLRLMQDLEKQGQFARRAQIGQDFLGMSETQSATAAQNADKIIAAQQESIKKQNEAGQSTAEQKRQAELAAEATKKWSDAVINLQRIYNQAFGEIAPNMNWLLGKLNEVLEWVQRFNAAHPGAATIEAIGGIGVGVTGALAALGQLSRAWRGVAAAARGAAGAFRLAWAAASAPATGVLGAIGATAFAAYTLWQQGTGKKGSWTARDSENRFLDPSMPSGGQGGVPGWTAAPLPKNDDGGMVNRSGAALVHAGKSVLPRSMTETLVGLGQGSFKRAQEMIGDWLGGGSNAPKVLIANIDDFVRQFQQAQELAQKGAGGDAGGGAGGGGGEGGPSTPGGEAGKALGGAVGAASKTGADLSRKGGSAGAAGPLAGAAIDVFKKRGWSDAAIQAVMAHGLGEGGFGEAWKKSLGSEQSYGHWQFNMKGGEGPAYMKWAAAHNLDPHSTSAQAQYVAETMEARSPGFGQTKDFDTAFAGFETKFERSRGGVAGKLAYARKAGTIETAKKAVEGYNQGTPNAAPSGDTATPPPKSAPPPASAAPPAPGTAELLKKYTPAELAAYRKRGYIDSRGVPTMPPGMPINSAGAPYAADVGGATPEERANNKKSLDAIKAANDAAKGKRASLDRMNDTRIGGDSNNYGNTNNVTINQNNANNFSGEPGPMMARVRDSQDRATGDLVRNFRAAVV